MNVFIILLGCNIFSILLDRINSSLEFIENNYNIVINDDIKNNLTNKNIAMEKINLTQITWFLSGGIKNNLINSKSEASIMKYQIDNNITLKYNLKKKNLIQWNYVLDELSTNTAENLIRASQYLNTTSEFFDLIYIVTSKYHKKRAEYMLKLIDSSKNFKWILGNLEENNSEFMEKIHMKNVKNDVLNALKKISINK